MHSPDPSAGTARPPAGLRRQLLRAGVSSLALKGVFLTLQFAISVYLARTLGPEGLGIYAFSLATVALLTIPGELGFPEYLVRALSVYTVNGATALIHHLTKRSSLLVAAASLGVGLAAAFAIGLMGLRPDAMPPQPLLIALVLVPLLALLETNGGALRGLGYVLLGQVPIQILRPALTLASLLLLTAALDTFGVEHALLATVGATSLALLISRSLLKRRLPRPPAASQPPKIPSVRQSLPFLLLAAAQVLNHHTDILMIGALMSQAQVGLYRVAVQVADGLVLALLAITAVITPHLARLHAAQHWTLIRRLLVNSHRGGLAMLLPAAVIISVLSEEILAAIFGSPYAQASGALSILAFGKAAYSTAAFSGVALSMFGYAKVATYGTGGTVLINIALNLALIPLYGIRGAAVATAISSFLVAAALAGWILMRFDINITILGRAQRQLHRPST